MRAFIAIIVLLVTVSSPQAQPIAFLEVFDDPGFTQRAGVMDSLTKTVYVRLVSSRSPNEYVGLEFSLTGLHDFVGVIPAVASTPSVVLGTFAAPEDPESGTGGINIAWPTCQSNESVMTLTLISTSPPQNRSIQVARRYPPTNPSWPIPFLNQCDAPCFGCLEELGGQAYVLNPTVAVASKSWRAVKSLFR